MVTIPNQTKFVISNGTQSYKLTFAVNENGWIVVQVCDVAGTLVGTPIRFKQSDSGGRMAADFPSVDPAHFIVDNEGKITNG